MNKIIFIILTSLLIAGCDSDKKTVTEKDFSLVDAAKINEKISVQNSIINISDSTDYQISTLPIHGEINQELLLKYFPGITDTIKDLRIIGSEKIDLNLGSEIIVSILHNTGTFDEMIVCTHDSSLNLIDHFYIGKATMFDKTSHTIEYEIINKNSLRFDHVDWGYIKKGEELEVDTVKSESYLISVNTQGKIKKK